VKKLLTTAAVLVALFGGASAQRPRCPSSSSRMTTPPLAPAASWWTSTRTGTFLAVKAGPGLNYARIDKLYNNGAQERGDWWAIVYDRSGKWTEKCNVSDSISWPKRMPDTGPCRSGWVHKRWIKGVAG
jgi:hypothetical protein